MATTLKLPFVRFVAQVNTAPAEPKANYQALAGRNALALQKCEWREAAKSAKATLVTHNFTVSHSGDQYDAYLMTGDYNADNSTEVAYAGMAAYRFTLPAAYLSGSQTLVSMSLPVTRDRFLLPGVRVVAVLSDSAKPSASWATVRGEASPAASETEYLKNSATRITAALDDSGTLELDLAGADSAKKNYLWIYLTVEDYAATWTMYSKTEPRLYAIEGSAMIVGEDATVTFSADVDADGGLAFGGWDLLHDDFTPWIALCGTEVTSAFVSKQETLDNKEYYQAAFVFGDVPPSCATIPGWAVYDVTNGHFLTISLSADDPIIDIIRRNGGVKGVRGYLTATDGRVYLDFDTDFSVYGRNCFIGFDYNPTTGETANVVTTDPSYDSYSQSYPAIDAIHIAPMARVLKTGALDVYSGVNRKIISVVGGKVEWGCCVNLGRASNNRYLFSGTFTHLNGVLCDGLAVVDVSNGISRAYPLNLVFDNRDGIRFCVVNGGILIFGDFTKINGYEVNGAALICTPPSESLLDPSDGEYVAPDWQKLIVPVRYGCPDSPCFIDDIGFSPYPSLDGNPICFSLTGTVACVQYV